MSRCKRCRMFLLGVGVGAAAGVMLAPKSGSETRQEIFGGQLDILTEPGTETAAPVVEEPESAEALKTKIDETRARLKAEIEAQQEG